MLMDMVEVVVVLGQYLEFGPVTIPAPAKPVVIGAGGAGWLNGEPANIPSAQYNKRGGDPTTFNGQVAGGGGVVVIRVVVHQHHHLVDLMVNQEHQVDQDLVVVKMVMIMDLLVLVTLLLQVVMLVQLMDPPLHPGGGEGGAGGAGNNGSGSDPRYGGPGGAGVPLPATFQNPIQTFGQGPGSPSPYFWSGWWWCWWSSCSSELYGQ